jgi:hypothetical protein
MRITPFHVFGVLLEISEAKSYLGKMSGVRLSWEETVPSDSYSLVYSGLAYPQETRQVPGPFLRSSSLVSLARVLGRDAKILQVNVVPQSFVSKVLISLSPANMTLFLHLDCKNLQLLLSSTLECLFMLFDKSALKCGKEGEDNMHNTREIIKYFHRGLLISEDEKEKVRGP